MPGPDEELGRRVVLRHRRREPGVIDRLHIAACRQTEAGRPVVGPVCEHRRESVRFLEIALDRIVELIADAADDRIGDDRAREVVYIEEKDDKADEGEKRRHRHREMRHRLLRQLAVEQTEDEQDVDDRADEKSNHALRPPVADEISDEARPKLSRGERQHHHRDGDDQGHHRDQGAEQSRKEPARLLRGPLVQPPDGAGGLHVDVDE